MRKLWAFLSIGAKYRRNTFRHFSLLCAIGDSLTLQCQISGPSPTDVRFDSERAKFSCGGKRVRESPRVFLFVFNATVLA